MVVVIQPKFGWLGGDPASNAAYAAIIKDYEDGLCFEGAKPPRWRSGSPKGKRIAVWANGGLGDCVYCHRLVGELAKSAAHVYLVTFNQIVDALPKLANVTTMPYWEHSIGPVDYHVPLTDLLYLMQADIDNPLPPTGLIASSMPRLDGFNIGLCLSGNSDHNFDKHRSIPASVFVNTFADLFRRAVVTFHWLQKGTRPEDGPWLRRVKFHKFETVSDLASVAAGMDAVISIDTLTLHVAGELGKRTYGLLPVFGDVRWGEDREDCPWYPSLKLIRCLSGDGWVETSLLVRLREELDALLHMDRVAAELPAQPML